MKKLKSREQAGPALSKDEALLMIVCALVGNERIYPTMGPYGVVNEAEKILKEIEARQVIDEP